MSRLIDRWIENTDGYEVRRVRNEAFEFDHDGFSILIPASLGRRIDYLVYDRRELCSQLGDVNEENRQLRTRLDELQARLAENDTVIYNIEQEVHDLRIQLEASYMQNEELYKELEERGEYQ